MAAKRKLLSEYLRWAVYRPNREPGDQILFFTFRDTARRYSRVAVGKVKRVRVMVYEE